MVLFVVYFLDESEVGLCFGMKIVGIFVNEVFFIKIYFLDEVIV